MHRLSRAALKALIVPCLYLQSRYWIFSIGGNYLHSVLGCARHPLTPGINQLEVPCRTWADLCLLNTDGSLPDILCKP